MKANKRELKLLNFFNKRNNKNRKKRSRGKQWIIGSTTLVGNLLFGNLEIKDLKPNSTPLSHEKVISNQELNNLDSCRDSGKIIWTGDSTVLFNEPNDVIWVESDGILPGTEAFPLFLPQQPGGRTITGMKSQNPGQGGGGGLYNNLRRTDNPKVDLDFVAECIDSE